MHAFHATKHAQGFTLIELSIVLTIVGLILAGVITGRTMVHVSELNRTLTQIRETETAITAFYQKYGALPGDMKNATTYWPSASLVNGNGDGFINDPPGPESVNMWPMLVAAKLISCASCTSVASDSAWATYFNANLTTVNYAPVTSLGLYQNILYSPTYNSGASVTNPYHHYLSLQTLPGGYIYMPDSYNGGASFLSSYSTCNTSQTENKCFWLKPSDAQSLDTKIDDGNPSTGIMINAEAAVGCGTSANIYNTSITVNSCAAMIKILQ